MQATTPRFRLFSEANAERQRTVSEWRFVLRIREWQRADWPQRTMSQTSTGERLELLAVVRGLEALDQPSHVTLMTSQSVCPSRNIAGLGEWRENGWRWESFGRRVPVRNADLWRRIDRALDFHRIECRIWRLQAASDPV